MKKRKLSDCVATVSNVVGGVCILLMMVLISFEVIARNFLDLSTLVSDEYSGYLMVFITYWGAATAFHSGAFVRVEAFFDRFPKKVRSILNVIYELLFLVFNSYLLVYFFKSLHKVFIFQSEASTVARTPLWIPYGICWLGILIFEIYLVINLAETFVRKRKEDCAA